MNETFSQQSPNYCAKLTQFSLIEIQGADAEKYLQGQLTCDVAKLADGEHTLTAHCDPKGKMSGLFRLHRQDSTLFYAIIRTNLLPAALDQLKKYAVFSKVSFNTLSLPIFGTTSGQISAENGKNVLPLENPQGQKRYLLWNAELEACDNPDLWDLMDIQNGLPILQDENQFELIPQAVNLQCLEKAISFTKGCYIGQETIARAKYRGANKQAMFVLRGECEGAPSVEIGGKVEWRIGENWKSTGTILAAVSHNRELWLQVVLNKDIEPDSVFRYQDTLLKIVPLPYELSD